MKFCDERIQKHLLSGGKIKRRDIDIIVNIDKDKRLSCCSNSVHILTQYDLIYDGWEIVEPEYNWNKIIEDKILCVFNDYEDFSSLCYVGLLKEFNNENELPFKRKDGLDFRYCKLFNPAEFNIAKNLKEYEK